MSHKRRKLASGAAAGAETEAADAVADARALPGVSSAPALLVHKNRELAVLARRLQARLARKRARSEAAASAKERFESGLSCVRRALDGMLREALELAQGRIDVSEGISAEPELNGVPREVNDFAAAMFGAEARRTLMRRVAAVVPDISSGDDEEEKPPRPEEEMPEIVDEELGKSVRQLLAVFRAVMDRVVKATPFDLDAVKAKANLEGIQRKNALYADRILHLELQARKFQNQAEDAELEKIDAIRKLAGLAADALSGDQMKGVVQMLKTNGVELPGAEKLANGIMSKADTSASSSSSSSSSKQAAASTSESAKKENDQDASTAFPENNVKNGSGDEEAQILERLAQERLQELEIVLEEKKKHIAENKNLRHEILQIQRSFEDSQSDHTQLDLLQKECSRLRIELLQAREAESKERQSVELVKQDFVKLQDETLAEVKNRASSFAETERKLLEELRATQGELEGVKANADSVEILSKQVREMQQMLLTKDLELKTLRNQLQRRKESPAHVHDETLQAKLEEALKGKYPDAESLKAATIATELEAVKAELKAQTEQFENVAQDLEETADAFLEIESQKERMLKQTMDMEKTMTEKIAGFVRMNNETAAANHAMRQAQKEKEEMQKLLSEHDKQFQEVLAKLEEAQQARAFAEDHSKKTIASYDELAQERTADSWKVKRLEDADEAREKRLRELENLSAECKNEKEDAVHKLNRALEEKVKLKIKLERAKSYTLLDPASAKSEIEARLVAMENALRCPLRSEYWKDAIIIKCNHMFSKKALLDNLETRNRKCPTCKKLYNKPDIHDIYLYQENNYDE